MAKDLLIGVVGKPSAGKSTFFNAVAEKSSAKMGSYPFTTIEPNRGVTFYETACPCGSLNIACAPAEGYCKDHIRRVPVQLLDIAGLIPDAHAGAGLGNQFLDDIRQADVLLHIVDISGTTNEKGEETDEYDPTFDHTWLMSEITEWIFSNLYGHWTSIVRKTSSGAVDNLKILHEKLSGYNCRASTVKKSLEKCGYFGVVDYDLWTRDDIKRFCQAFVEQRFPTIIVLNKSEKRDGSPDLHIQNLTRTFPNVPVIMASAKSELLLRESAAKDYIEYKDGAVKILDQCPPENLEEIIYIKDRVIYRTGSTGVKAAIQDAVHLVDKTVVFPVKNLVNIRNGKGPAFEKALIVNRTGTVRELCESITHKQLGGLICESYDGSRITGDDLISSLGESPRIIRLTAGNTVIE